MRRLLIVVAGSGGMLAGLSTAGWLGATLILAAVVVATVAVGWVISDSSRTERLATLIDAIRRPPADAERLTANPTRPTKRARRPPRRRRLSA